MKCKIGQRRCQKSVSDRERDHVEGHSSYGENDEPDDLEHDTKPEHQSLSPIALTEDCVSGEGAKSGRPYTRIGELDKWTECEPAAYAPFNCAEYNCRP
jgi:hypothetical protein